MKKVMIFIAAIMFMSSSAFVFAGEYTGRKMSIKFATEETERDFMTVWANKFADEMRTWSDGKIDIAVYPYGTLGDTRDINELCQIGVIEFVFSDFAWISSFVPQAQVLALHYLWPREKTQEVLDWVVKNGEIMPLLEKKFRNRGMVPLAIMWEGWQWITSKKPIYSIEDMQGLKLRLMSSKLLVEDYKAYGASPTPMQYGEVYGALQMGMIDAQANPIAGDYSMKFYEVTDYFIQIYAEPFLGIPTANMQFFDSLPKNAQEKIRKWWLDAIMPSSNWIDDFNAADMERIKKEKPSIEFTVLSDEKIAAFKEKAKTVYPKFSKIGGEGAQEVLDTLLVDVENAKKALGIKN
jgi:tripartite ATP-independent transporter DctP family solute receptor